MMTCEYAGEPFTEARSHPWTDTAGSPDCRYYDLTATPAHIRTSLEDFRPWSHYPAIEDFFVLLEGMNQVGSTLESNDCAFTGPHPADEAPASKAYQCSGRVMVLFRALERNTAVGSVETLKNQLHARLSELDHGFRWGVIGTTLVPVRYLALEQLGMQLMISFWAWGDSEADAMVNLQRVFKNLALALLTVTTQ